MTEEATILSFSINIKDIKIIKIIRMFKIMKIMRYLKSSSIIEGIMK